MGLWICRSIHDVVDFARQYPGENPSAALERVLPRAEGQACVDYGLHVILTDVTDQVLTDLTHLIRHEGVTSFKMLMAFLGGRAIVDGENWLGTPGSGRFIRSNATISDAPGPRNEPSGRPRSNPTDDLLCRRTATVALSAELLKPFDQWRCSTFPCPVPSADANRPGA